MSLRRLATFFAAAMFAKVEGASRPVGAPRQHRNGGTRTGAAAAKRAARKRRNIAKHARGAS